MNQSTAREILVTSALPYANGPIHLGHLLGYIQADIWVAFQKLCGVTCHYICADDAHGTAIMLKATELGITPEQLIAQVQTEHLKDFTEFDVRFDCYHSTHSEENKLLSEQFYQRNLTAGYIKSQMITQLFDEAKQLFLADRYVKGQCPRCKATDQYGDNCEVCGATYSATELLNPISTLSGQPPILKASEQLFFDLPQFQEALSNWLQSGSLQPEIANKLREWFASGLKPWDISREAPYFGFKIPGYDHKYFYVWLDAPIGYLASFKKLCAQRSDLDFDHYWQPHSSTEIYHFIGKDIVSFHGLFWPALLLGADYRWPTALNVHGFITINGQKMSKSRGTFITARSYLNYLNPAYLRYYFAAKLTPKVDDFDLNFDDFTARVNADLVGKWINIASRCAKFINQFFDHQLSPNNAAPELLQMCQNAQTSIAEAYQQRDFSRAIREIMALADQTNQYIDQEKPWILMKQTDEAARVQDICTVGLNSFRLLTLYLKPVLPSLATEIETFLNIAPLQWVDSKTLLFNHKINLFQPLLQRIDAKQIQQLMDPAS